MELSSRYKQTEVGLLPEDWEVIPIGELFTFKNGLNKAKRFFGYGTPIVNYMDVFRHPGLRVKDVVGLVDVGPREMAAYQVRKGDVFFTRTSETIDEIGVSSVMLDTPENTVFSGFILRARPKDKSLDDRFKAYCFSSRYFREQVTSRASYTTRALTNGRSLSAAFLARPGLAEQSAIAAALSDVDAALADLERLIAKKRNLKQAAMQHLLTGSIRLPGFSENWELKRLGDHVSFLKNGTHSRAQLAEDGPVKNLHYGDIHGADSIWLPPATTPMPTLSAALATPLDRLTTGDLILVDASEDLNGVGTAIEITEMSDVEVVAGLHTIAARFDKEVLVDGFKAFLQFIPAFRDHLCRLAAGTKVLATNRSHIASAEIKLPMPKEQMAITSILSDMDTELAALRAQCDKTRLLKQAMMQELLTGRIRLPLPDDAPEAKHG